MGAKLLDTQTHGRQFIDRYEIMGEIASGGMATVYLARLTGVGGFQRLYAIKRLHPHLAGEKEFVEMFLDEARLAAGIHHPQVVPILEVGASQTGYYLVMEYIEGETLARLLARAGGQRTPIPPQVVIRIGIDMLLGLHAAHELKDETGALAGLVHRDVSPQNVLVGADGISRITDFGVARAASRLTATRVGQLKGKIAYMAPEQATGSEDLDRRADVFASGIVIWEGLAHKRLFKAENEAATLSRVISEPIPVLGSVAPHIPRPVSDVIMRALERDLARRYASCADFADDLERAAIQTGLLGTSRDLQAYLQSTLGAEIDEQRNALRTWAQRNEGDPSGPHHGALSQSGSRPVPDFRESTLSRVEAPKGSSIGAKIGLLIGLAVVGAALFIAYDRFAPKTPTVSAVTPPPAAVPVPSAPPVAALPTSAPLPALSSPGTAEPVASAGGDLAAPGAPAGTSSRRKPASAASANATATAAPSPAPVSKPKPKPIDDLGENPYR